MSRPHIARKIVRTLSVHLAVAAVLSGGACWRATASARANELESPPHPPRGAPNILLIMTDDVGFAASSTFGGLIPTPTYDELAAEGIRYNEFHVTAMCSPSRAALLTGRNHHMVNMATVADLATMRPGYSSVIPKSAATIGKVLRENGYDTAWLGKNHITPEWEITPLGPYDHWPNGLGFAYFYGFMDGATNQFEPTLVENRTFLPPPRNEPDYILDKDLANHAIDWLRMQHTLHPDTPFLLYYAPGTSHSPHQAPPAWIARFNGQFTEGWDRMREEIFARQKRLGIIPADAQLTPRPEQIPAWDSLSPAEQKLAVRFMQVYAGALAYSDHEIGRIFTELKSSGQWNNTLVIFIQGDNGASGEGTILGNLDDLTGLNGIELDPKWEEHNIALAGGVHSFENYAVGFAWAMDTPFQWMKQFASHLGGARDPVVISWPGHLRDRNVVRSQFTHLIDIAPTLYQAAGITPPVAVDGVRQMPLQGVSMVYTFTEPNAPSRHRKQYFEMMGNRAYYDNGWMAATHPERFPWIHPKPGQRIPDVNDYPWELYDLRNDYSERWNLASRYPGKLAQLKREFMAAARENHVLPLDNGLFPRIFLSSRPYDLNGRTHFVFHRDGFLYPDQAFPDVMNRSWTVSATVDVAKGDQGAIITQGGWLSGWGLLVLHGRPTFVYKTTPEPGDKLEISSPEALAPGHHVIDVSVHYDGPGLGKSASAKLDVDGKSVASGRIERTVSGTFPWDYSKVGQDVSVPLTAEYQSPFTFQGRIEKVVIDLSTPD